MEDIQYNNIQKQQKSRNNNLKESIICYKCGQKSHIKRNCSIFKYKKVHLETKNMMSHWKFNNIKFNNVKTFNIIHTTFFWKKNADNSPQKKTNNEKSENEQMSKKTFFID